MNKKSSNIWELPYIDIQKSELRSYCQVSLWDESGYWKFIEPYIQKRFPLRQLRFKLENRSSEYEYDLSSLHVQKDGESLTYIPVVRIIILGCETKQDYSDISLRFFEELTFCQSNRIRPIVLYAPINTLGIAENKAYKRYQSIYDSICSDVSIYEHVDTMFVSLRKEDNMEDQEIPEINVNDVKMELKKKSSSSSISSTSSSYQNLSISPESSGTNLVSMNSTSSKNKSLFKISFSKSQKVDFVHQWNRAAHLIQTNYEEALFQYIQQLKSSFSSFISKRNSTVPDYAEFDSFIKTSISLSELYRSIGLYIRCFNTLKDLFYYLSQYYIESAMRSNLCYFKDGNWNYTKISLLEIMPVPFLPCSIYEILLYIATRSTECALQSSILKGYFSFIKEILDYFNDFFKKDKNVNAQFKNSLLLQFALEIANIYNEIYEYEIPSIENQKVMAMILYSYGIVPTRSLVNEQLQYHMTDSLFNNKRVFVNLLKELNKCYNHLKENNCPFDKKRSVDDDDDEDNDVLELHTSNTVFGIHSIPPSPQELESSTHDKNELSEPPNEQNYHSQSKEGNTDDVRSDSSSQLDNIPIPSDMQLSESELSPSLNRTSSTTSLSTLESIYNYKQQLKIFSNLKNASCLKCKSKNILIPYVYSDVYMLSKYYICVNDAIEIHETKEEEELPYNPLQSQLLAPLFLTDRSSGEFYITLLYNIYTLYMSSKCIHQAMNTLLQIATFLFSIGHYSRASPLFVELLNLYEDQNWNLASCYINCILILISLYEKCPIHLLRYLINILKPCYTSYLKKENSPLFSKKVLESNLNAQLYTLFVDTTVLLLKTIQPVHQSLVISPQQLFECKANTLTIEDNDDVYFTISIFNQLAVDIPLASITLYIQPIQKDNDDSILPLTTKEKIELKSKEFTNIRFPMSSLTFSECKPIKIELSFGTFSVVIVHFEGKGEVISFTPTQVTEFKLYSPQYIPSNNNSLIYLYIHLHNVPRYSFFHFQGSSTLYYKKTMTVYRTVHNEESMRSTEVIDSIINENTSPINENLNQIQTVDDDDDDDDLCISFDTIPSNPTVNSKYKDLEIHLNKYKNNYESNYSNDDENSDSCYIYNINGDRVFEKFTIDLDSNNNCKFKHIYRDEEELLVAIDIHIPDKCNKYIFSCSWSNNNIDSSEQEPVDDFSSINDIDDTELNPKKIEAKIELYGHIPISVNNHMVQSKNSLFLQTMLTNTPCHMKDNDPEKDVDLYLTSYSVTDNENRPLYTYSDPSITLKKIETDRNRMIYFDSSESSTESKDTEPSSAAKDVFLIRPNEKVALATQLNKIDPSVSFLTLHTIYVMKYYLPGLYQDLDINPPPFILTHYIPLKVPQLEVTMLTKLKKNEYENSYGSSLYSIFSIDYKVHIPKNVLNMILQYASSNMHSTESYLNRKGIFANSDQTKDIIQALSSNQIYYESVDESFTLRTSDYDWRSFSKNSSTSSRSSEKNDASSTSSSSSRSSPVMPQFKEKDSQTTNKSSYDRKYSDELPDENEYVNGSTSSSRSSSQSIASDSSMLLEYYIQTPSDDDYSVSGKTRGFVLTENRTDIDLSISIHIKPNDTGYISFFIII